MQLQRSIAQQVLVSKYSAETANILLPLPTRLAGDAVCMHASGGQRERLVKGDGLHELEKKSGLLFAEQIHFLPFPPLAKMP